MKRRVKFFLDTYFYFNQQERKGLISLIILVVLVQMAGMLYANFIANKPITLRNISSKELSFLDQNDSAILKEKFNEYQSYKEKKYPQNHSSKFIKDKYKRDTTFAFKQPRKFELVNINLADSVALVALPKIGPVLAGRIVQYRNRLGGFHSLGQLTEVWGFKEDLLYDLEGKIFIDPNFAPLININTVGLDELKKHPYFKFTLSQALINYRKQHGNFQSLLDLKKIRLVNDSIFNLISPYCSF